MEKNRLLAFNDGVIAITVTIMALELHGTAFYDARIAQALFVAVALIWLAPDRQIERAVMGK